MNFLRFILIAFLGWILWRFTQRWYQNFLISKQEKKPNSTTKKLGPMVRCNHCGLFFPESEAIKNGEVYYCCEEHQSCFGNGTK